MAKDNPAEFRADVSKWVEKAKGNTRGVITETIQDINFEIIVNWPVLTGLSRGSWFAQIGSMPSGRGAAGADPYARCNLVAAELELGQTYYMGNTADYSRRLELGFVGVDSLGRHYNQAGRYIVTTALAKAPRLAEAAAERIANGQLSGPRPVGATGSSV